jgi:peptide/nickel transport system substrate-binding protein
VTAVDDHKVRFVTTAPSGAFLYQLASNSGAYVIPQAYFNQVGGDAFQLAPVGTGPFKLTEYAPDTHISFVRNESYFDGLSAAKSVVVGTIPEVSTRIAALLNGEQDIVLDLPPDQIATIEQRGDFTVDAVAPQNVQVIQFFGINAPVDKKEIRQAMSLGIDRQTIVEELLLGYGVWPSGLQSPADPLYTERPQLPYDPDQAKALLAQAGYAGEEIQFVFDSPDYYPLEQVWAEAVAGMWTELGLNIKLVPMDVTVRATLDGSDPYHCYAQSMGVTADNVFPTGYLNESSFYEKFFPAGTFTELNEIVAEASKTVDNVKRGELYTQALDFHADFVPQAVLFTVDRIGAMTNKISWKQNPDFTIDLLPAHLTVS